MHCIYFNVVCFPQVFRLPRKLPQHIALELVLTGDPISAERAHQVWFGMAHSMAG